ncbi:MAG: peptide chain release factor 2 [Clostridia bacterium]
MIILEEKKQKLLSLKDDLLDLKEAIKYDDLTEKSKLLDEKSADNQNWSDVVGLQKIMRQSSLIKNKLAKFDKLFKKWEENLSLCELCIAENEESFADEIITVTDDIEKELSDFRLETLLNGEYDKNNAILTFHAGAGGTEAQDWVEMLYRMYTRYAERHGFKYKILDYLNGDEAGIKSATILIEGENVYGYLKSEVGVHRLVRISPFDTSGRRHTSFASIEVVPEIDDSIVIDIKDEDLRVDTYRSGGAGGQHVNKTESAIRITHIPSGVVVACQNERSQHQNREVAMKMLKSKLVEIKEREHLDKVEDIKGVQKDIAWGSQIRSYVFMPYTLVKDHRTNFEMGNINAVMDGEIDEFINAYLKFNSKDN